MRICRARSLGSRNRGFVYGRLEPISEAMLSHQSQGLDGILVSKGFASPETETPSTPSTRLLLTGHRDDRKTSVQPSPGLYRGQTVAGIREAPSANQLLLLTLKSGG